MALLRDTDPLAGLNPAQRAAVEHHEGPLLVLAGAGSGKTRVLTTRIARLIRHHGVPPREILAVTFTNKAAGEMRERIARLLGEAPTGLWAGTFHAIGARMIREHAAALGRTPQFTIYDEDDTLATVKRVMERLRLSPRDWAPQALLAQVSDAKNALVSPAEYADLARDPRAKAAAAVYGALEDALRAQNAVTFDDLLVLPVRLLEADPGVLARYRARFRWLLVDEYQDTNRAQYRLVALLAGPRGNVAVVGDDDQSIYGWRGADIRNILDFERDFPNAAVVRLEENYRSAPPILALANAVIAANTERRGKTLRPTRTGGEPVTLVRAADERDEADTVVEEMRARRAGRDALLLREMAVLYRTNAQSRAFEEALRRHGLPYRLVGGTRFYDRREIRDLVAYLKLVANPADDEAFRRAIAVPKRGLGEATVEQLAEAARAAGVPLLAAAARDDLLAALAPAKRAGLAAFAALVDRLRAQAAEAGVDELLRALIEAVGYEEHLRAEGPEGQDRLDNVRELVTSAAEVVADDEGEVGLRPLDHFLQRATLVAGVDQLDPSADAVTLMTLHNAKGLEFPLVFVAGLEDGLFPLARAYEDPAMLEEERRLLYVGITRAERTLVLSWAEQRRRNGELVAGRRSSFLEPVLDQLERRDTMRARATGRAAFGDAGAARGTGGASRWQRAWRDAPDDGTPAASPTRRRPGTPVAAWDPVEESQDAPVLAAGARVRHRKFGEGTIAELSGTGRDAKVKIDFDDETVGRKTLVVAQANLERGTD
ncbi:MAG: ATP-dependent helicase [Gemmatimonadota bacterium]|jgi:DNA helicase-2/ATP-dependent DNA helicase PcrA|nr:UvrD-helicase domain-containing protein [Gemmatimonadota bacterium]